jgi:hypothetical protein
MKRSLIIFLLPALLFSFSACHKSHDPAPKTKTELMSQSSWKFSNATVNGVSVSSSLQQCQKDNILTFSSNLTGVLDEGPTKCNSGDPQTQNFSWNFASNESMLHISTVLFAGGGQDFNIVNLTESQLVLSQMISGQTAVVYFVH